MKVKILLLLMLGIWMGMLLGISFLEAPLKFKAPNMTLTLGLGIGQLVFTALNRIEIMFSILLSLWLFFNHQSLATLTTICLTTVVVMIALQTFWLLPILNARIDSWLSGVEIASTYHHLCYIVFEVLKVLLLFYGFVKVFPNE